MGCGGLGVALGPFKAAYIKAYRREHRLQYRVLLEGLSCDMREFPRVQEKGKNQNKYRVLWV